MGVDILFIGLIFVGLVLTVKVVTEGLKHLNEKRIKLDLFKATAEKCRAKTQTEAQKLKEIESSVRELEREFQLLADKEHSLETQVRALKEKLPQRPKAHMG